MRATFSIIYLLHMGATLALAGLCWFVQVVHYPLFVEVGRDNFARYEQLHAQRTSWVVAPLMLAELGSGLLLLGLLSGPLSYPVSAQGGLILWLWAAMVMLAAIWLSTFFVQVPLHGMLASGYEADIAAKLVRTNWIRTLLWTLRGAILLVLTHPLFAAPGQHAAASWR